MGSTERIRNVAKRVAKWVRAGHQMVVVPSAMSGETNRLLGTGQGSGAGQGDREAMRELDMIAATGEQVSVGLLSLALQAEGLHAVSYAGWQVPIQTDSAYHQGAHRAHRRRPRARRSGRRQGGDHHRLSGHRRRRPHHHARPRRLRHLGRGGGRGDEGRRVPDLHRRRRRLHHRPAHRARGAAPDHRELRRDARDGEPGLQGAADPLGGVRRQVPRAAARAVQLHALGHPDRRRGGIGHADHFRGRRKNGTSRRLGHRLQSRRSQGHA